MTPFQRSLQATMDRFAGELEDLIKVAAKEQILRHLGMGEDEILKLPNRRPVYLGPSKARGRAPTAEKVSPDDLSPKIRNAYDRIKKAKRPVTVENLEAALKVTKGNARYILGQLMSKQLVQAQRLGDGTAKKVYLLKRK